MPGRLDHPLSDADHVEGPDDAPFAGSLIAAIKGEGAAAS
jgi:hypothetical protein